MIVRRFEYNQVLPISQQAAWDFFSQPSNLAKITPADMHFEHVDGEEGPIYAGQIFTHRVRPMFHIPVRWTSEIAQVEAPDYFADRQVAGPFAYWQHLHRFEAIDESNTRVTDIVHCALPGGIVGDGLGRKWMNRLLDQTFAHRHTALDDLFLSSPQNGG